MTNEPRCELCGEPMPDGETMFKFHGYSGPCPKPPLPKESPLTGLWAVETGPHGVRLVLGTGVPLSLKEAADAYNKLTRTYLAVSPAPAAMAEAPADAGYVAALSVSTALSQA